MTRQIVPGMFWVGLLAGALLVVGSVRASGPSVVLNVLGIWDGFYLAADGATGPVTSDVTQQDFRRLAGDGVMSDLGGSDLEYRFDATLARPDFLTGTGVTTTGRLVFQADLATFTGLGGDAGVMFPEYHLVPPGSGPSRISGLLLHPFPGMAAPNLAGRGQGSFVSLPDPTIPGALADPRFTGVGTVQISPRNPRDSFAGEVKLFLDPNQPAILSWPLLATSSNNRRVIMISQGKTGRIVYDGVVVPGQTARSPTFVGGFFRLVFNSGGTQFGAFNFSLSQ
jgi:hypothetical protein